MKRGLAFALGSTVVWGCLPLFWRALEPLPSLYILSSRILWATVFSGIVILLSGRGKRIAAVVRDKRLLLRCAGAGWMIAFNWFLGIAAVNSGHTLDSTMGSFLNALSCCLFAWVIFHEVPARLQAAGIAVAAAGVLWMTAFYGSIPWIALCIAGTFGLYSTLKKNAAVDPLSGLFLEGLMVLPLCLPYIVAAEARGSGALALLEPSRIWLVPAIGIVTGLPLLLYAHSLHTLPLGLAGFLQYITSFLSLFIALAVFRESFSPAYLAGYGFIWTALVLFLTGSFRRKDQAASETGCEGTGTDRQKQTSDVTNT